MELTDCKVDVSLLQPRDHRSNIDYSSRQPNEKPCQILVEECVSRNPNTLYMNPTAASSGISREEVLFLAPVEISEDRHNR